MRTLGLIVESAPDANVAEAVRAAVRDLCDRDAYLLQVDANERSITHRLAAYLAPRFPGWHVDCEYNRDGFDPKMVDLQNDGDSNDTDGSRIYPDIIVHRRGKPKNLLVIEVKKTTSHRSDEADLAKLSALRQQLGYKHALFLRLGCGGVRPTIDSVSWI